MKEVIAYAIGVATGIYRVEIREYVVAAVKALIARVRKS